MNAFHTPLARGTGGNRRTSLHHQRKLSGDKDMNHKAKRPERFQCHETALESAIQNFHVEYGTLPDVGRHIVTTDSPDGVRLLKILLGLEDVSVAPQNTRGIRFLSVREGKNRRNGLIYTEDGMPLDGLFDVYGNGYTVALHVKPGEPVVVPFGKKTIELMGRDCAVFSPGKDGKPGTADDVRTW